MCVQIRRAAFGKSRKYPLELDVLSQILCPALGYPGPLPTSSFSGGRCPGDMNSFESLSGPADCGTSLGFASSSTWSKPGCWPGWVNKEKALQGHQGGDVLLGTHWLAEILPL